MKRWALIDVSWLCFRAFYAGGNFEKNKVISGFFRQIDPLAERYENRLAFCFDSRSSKRKEIYPEYKGGRRIADEQKRREIAEVKEQIVTIRRGLRRIGWVNVFCFKGYEADDIIASLIQNHFFPKGRAADIISNDSDLYQLLLSPNIRMVNPTTKRVYTQGQFLEEWGIQPELWAMVKAIAGCKADNVRGIQGIGEKTAAKWVRGQIQQGTRKWKRISDHIETINRNIRLVRLPFPGIPQITLRKNKPVEKERARLLNRFGAGSRRRRKRGKEKQQ